MAAAASNNCRLANNRPIGKWIQDQPEIGGGFSATDIRKVTVTLGDPDIYHVKSYLLASFLGHSEATQNKFCHQKRSRRGV